jgi:hypothetical protein
VTLDRSFLKVIREQLVAVDKEITELQRQRAALSAVLGNDGTAPASKPVVRRAAKVAAPANGDAPAQPTSATAGTPGVRKNYIALALPEITRCGGEMSLSAIRTYLATLPGLANIAANNLNAAIQNELKKGPAARLIRTAPGVYGLPEANAVNTAAQEVLPEEIPDAPVGAAAPGY